MANETTASECLIDTDLGANGGRVRIRNIEEFEQWVEREREFWSWMDEKTPNQLQFVRNHVYKEINKLASVVNKRKLR